MKTEDNRSRREIDSSWTLLSSIKIIIFPQNPNKGGTPPILIIARKNMIFIFIGKGLSINSLKT